MAELKAKHLMHYHGRSLVPVIAVLLGRPKQEASSQSLLQAQKVDVGWQGKKSFE